MNATPHNDPATGEITLAAPAKLNLSLAIGPRQDDGYHLLESLMVPLDLYDDVTVAASQGSSAGIELHAFGPTAGGVPADRTNLACRAAELLAAEAGRTIAPVSQVEHEVTKPQAGTSADQPPPAEVNQPAGLIIRLHKRIPVGGGLAGGSADAAATLLGLNRLWGLGWPIERLADLGATLGSDVPFCVYSQPSWVRGRGQIVQPLASPLPPLWALLIFPGLAVSTRAVYERLDAMRAGAQTRMITRKRRLADLECFNDLESAAFEVCPPLGRLFERLERTVGVPGLMVAGSGSTLCAIFDNPGEPRHWEECVKSQGSIDAAVVTVNPRPSNRTCRVVQGDSNGC